jgi:tetratricopeptide (TPR) repeat protein
MASSAFQSCCNLDDSAHSRRGRLSSAFLCVIALALALAPGIGCRGTQGPGSPQLIYTPEAFSAALLERVPGIDHKLTIPPFLVEPEYVERANDRILEVPIGPDRVRALVDALSASPPKRFGLEYNWLASTNAHRTLESRMGNCVALASVLVGLGRGLGWPIYYAEARARRLETHEYEEITFVADHMVVIVAARTFQLVIDFTGELSEDYTLKPIDDLTAYAHLINNVAGQRIALAEGRASVEDWQLALKGFELASQIQPDLGRAWNNRGVALTRLERFDEAKLAYERALVLDTSFDSAQRNLEIMQTRSAGKTTVAEKSIPR